MAENIDVNVNVNSSQAQRNLSNLDKSLSGVASSFAKLRTALGGLAFGSFITNALRFADGMQDVSNATGIATANVLGFSQAVQQNGGTIQDAQNALLRFVQTIGEAADGSAQAQQAFKEVGVTLNDLATLSEKDLFNKTIIGLSQVSDKSKQAVLSTELLGKTLRGTEIAKLANDYTIATINAQKYAGAIKTGAEVQQNLEGAITNLQTALLVVLRPIGELAKAITTNIDSTVRWLNVIKELLIVAAGFFAFTRIIGILGKMKDAAVGVAGALKQVSKDSKFLGGFGLTWKDITVKLGDTLQKMKKFVKENKELAPIAETVTRGIKRVYDNLAKLAESAIAATVAFLGLSRAYDAFKAGAEDFNKPLVIVGAGAMEMPEDYFKKGREARREVIEANQKLNDSLQQIRANYEKNKEATDAAAASEVAFAMMATDIADQIKAQQQAYQDLQNTIDELIQKRNELSSKQTEQKALIDSEIEALQAQIPVALENARVRVEALQEVRNAQQELIRQNELLKNQLESDLQLNQLRDQIELIGLMGDKLEDAQLIMQVSQTLEQELLELRKQELDLIARKGQLTEEQFKKELAQINALRTAASERANKELEIRREQKEKELELEDSYLEGVKKAIEDMADQFKPINMAQDAIKRGFDQIGDAVEQFVETGKFNFKDFARSVLADLAKMLAKAALFKALSATLGFFGLSIPGLAEGGPAKKGQPYLVGEKGPELFVPRESGTVVPNNRMNDTEGSRMVNAPVTNNYITNNINALDAKSVAQLFAENRKALLGSVRTAEKELPYRA